MLNEKNINESKSSTVLSKLQHLPLFAAAKRMKNVWPIMAVIVFVVVVLIVMNTSFGSKAKSTGGNDNSNTQFVSTSQYVADLENRLTQVLSRIKGAGETKVMVTVSNSPEIKVAQNVEEKTVSTGSGSTVTVVTTPVLIDVSGEKQPLITMEVVPKVQGVIVVSSGASDIRVRLDMLYAIQALLDVPNENIQIFAGI